MAESSSRLVMRPEMMAHVFLSPKPSPSDTRRSHKADAVIQTESTTSMSFRALSAALWFVSTLFVLYGLCVVVIALIADASGLPLFGPLLSRSLLIDKISPMLILLLFAWVLFEIALKQREVHRQHAAIAMFQTQMAEADQNRYQPKPFDLKQPRAIRRADLIIECSRREPSSLHEAIPGAAVLDASTLATSYGPLNVYAWILPVLGFIGTASGMASAIDGFKEVLRGGQVQVETLASELSQSVIPGLSAAFETTILALGAALVAYLCTSALRSWDQEALDQLDRLCMVLLSRIPQPPTPDGQKILAVLEQISAQLKGMLQVPATLEDAAKAISATADSLASSTNLFASAVNAISTTAETLASASSQSASAATAIREAAEALNSRGDKPASETNAKSTADEDLASAIKDLKDAFLAPIVITMSRDTR
jgi:biopolymer transport protein ExbB/TolQ